MIASLREFFALESRNPFRKMILLSLSFHFLIICVAFISPRISSKRIHYPAVFHRVNLVSFPAASPRMPGSPAGKKAGPEVSSPAAKSETAPPAAKPKISPPATKSKATSPVAKPAPAPKAPTSRSTKKLPGKEKPSEQAGTEAQISSALAEIRREVASRQGEVQPGEGSTTGPGGGIPGKWAGEGTFDPEIQDYYQLVREKIRENWILPDIIARSSRNLKLTVCLRIGKDGKITESWIDESSGLNYFDQSLLRAVRKTGSLPPPPRKIIGDFLCPKYSP
ncbi:MAG: TonB family protein [Deltaproteobacteria bacterium]|nr:MAG: TonB family protein [Deltaproteobacteria bacterium]